MIVLRRDGGKKWGQALVFFGMFVVLNREWTLINANVDGAISRAGAVVWYVLRYAVDKTAYPPHSGGYTGLIPGSSCPICGLIFC